ncbi:hypothetical protein Apa02nite_100220 [Actinoplanes palleronii]|uniref:Mutator family transposase n=1 Tax=Actinoplanes palleronii TaxID=113570 RepID=A0ABQ4BTA3_9ACTN|nr:hypothetical protein Apa02nite_100220 [Actinoplanes palleronii]
MTTEHLDRELADVSPTEISDDQLVATLVVRARGHFPNETAALKCVYMALMSLDPTGAGRRRWTMRWKAPLNAFQTAFEGRLDPVIH